MKLNKILAATLLLLTAATGAYATDLKLGLVNRQVFEDSLYVKNIKEKLKKEFGAREESLITREKELRSKLEQLERDRDVLSETERVKKEREITTLRQSLQADGAAFQDEVMRRQEKEQAAFNKVLNDVLSSIAKEEKLDLILDKQLALFNGAKADFSYKALQLLDKKYKEDKKS